MRQVVNTVMRETRSIEIEREQMEIAYLAAAMNKLAHVPCYYACDSAAVGH